MENFEKVKEGKFKYRGHKIFGVVDLKEKLGVDVLAFSYIREGERTFGTIKYTSIERAIQGGHIVLEKSNIEKLIEGGFVTWKGYDITEVVYHGRQAVNAIVTIFYQIGNQIELTRFDTESTLDHYIKQGFLLPEKSPKYKKS